MGVFNEEDVLKRLNDLEKVVFGNDSKFGRLSVADFSLKKTISLSELARNELLDNGQKKIAVIVGYNEKILAQEPMSMPEIKEMWKRGKFIRKCDPKLLERALVDGLVREPEKNTYDLTQRGEDFFDDVVGGGKVK